MPMDDDIAISGDEEEEISDEENEVVETPGEVPEETKVNGTTEEEEAQDNSTSDIEDNDLRETLSDDSDKIQVCFICSLRLNYQNISIFIKMFEMPFCQL